MRLTLPAAILTLLLLSSCSAPDTALAEETAAIIERPDIALVDATYTLTTSSGPVRVTAAETRYWMDEGRVEIDSLVFEQTDSDGSVKLSGNAGSATVDTATEIAVLEGGVEMASPSDNLSISAPGLVFDTARETVETTGEFTVSFDGGTTSGRGLSADLKRMSFDIAQSASGEVDG